MTSSNWLELALLGLIVASGAFLRRYFKRKLQRYDGFEGIIRERGKLPARRKLSIEEEKERLESILGRK